MYLYIRDYKIIDEKDGIVDVQAKTATKEDIRDNLFFEFAEEKLPIIKMERESLSLEDVFLKLTGQDVEEVESEAKKASEQIEKQGHHGFSFKRKKKADSGSHIPAVNCPLSACRSLCFWKQQCL